ncbi:transposase family protein [Acidisoma silvae]|uniref:Transposase n=1 Tax=Acidisoma silvae TaxID=2802396 RepID=A0A963YWN8_9PROT|nr:transposase [Acidisoma silvae]
MKKVSEWSPGLSIKICEANRIDGGWIVSAVMSGGAHCPMCGTHFSRRHGWYIRDLQDLPAQGAAVKLRLRVVRWRCLNPGCAQMTCGGRLPEFVAPYSRRTRRVVELGSCARPRGWRTAGLAADDPPRRTTGGPGCRSLPSSAEFLPRNQTAAHASPGRPLQLGPQQNVVLQEPRGLVHRYRQPEVTEL